MVVETYRSQTLAKKQRVLSPFADHSGRLMAGERYARRRTWTWWAIIIRNPDHPAVPSQYDLDHAWPPVYIIVSVQKGSAADLRSWRLQADRSRFDEEEITKGT